MLAPHTTDLVCFVSQVRSKSVFLILHFTESTPITVPSSGAGQPIPFDVNGDLKIDLLGVTPGSTSLSVWRNVFNGSDPDSSVFSM